MTTTKAAKAATPKAPAKVSHAKAKPAPARELPSVSSVKLVPLNLIDVQPQVRTVFDEDSLQELAEDIQTRGLLQPVLLNPNGQRFTLIAGERRVRACNLAGLTDIPALITKASSGDALLMQLAENIQREDLELEDQVQAIRALHDSLQSVAAVADTIKKSSAWVSKRLALSHPDLSWQARQLMEDGTTEDVEILNGLSTLCELSYSAGCNMADAIRKGDATRATVREALKAEKERRSDEHGLPATTDAVALAERAQRDAEYKASQTKDEAEYKERQHKRKHGTGPEFIEGALATLQGHCAEPCEDDDNGTGYLNSLTEAQRFALLVHLQAYQARAKGWTFHEWAKVLTPYDSNAGYIEQFVAVMAIKGEKLDNLYALVTILEGANGELEK